MVTSSMIMGNYTEFSTGSTTKKVNYDTPTYAVALSSAPSRHWHATTLSSLTRNPRRHHTPICTSLEKKTWGRRKLKMTSSAAAQFHNRNKQGTFPFIWAQTSTSSEFAGRGR